MAEEKTIRFSLSAAAAGSKRVAETPTPTKPKVPRVSELKMMEPRVTTTRPSTNAPVNIYVFKGTHHYISCQDDDLTQLPEEVICNPLFAWTCVNPKLITDLAAKGGCPG